ncbi:phosphomannomutase/phosphoglucomutase [Candidatus Dependentiae bacterium]|nr:MAG: phosphomannomutase/phosphoglucomutase [Candidatus Dependentiae bacterium]
MIDNNELRHTPMADSVFKEYDIRGKVGEELSLDEMYDLVCSIAYYFIHNNPSTKTVAVGMDGRIHSPHIKKQVCKALCDSGLNVWFLGLCPSPALYFAMHTLPVEAGIMITASHNPKEYNGLKICLGKHLVYGPAIKEIGRLFKEQKKVEETDCGKLSEYPIIEPYINWLADHFTDLKGMKLSVIIDCGNAVAGTVFPQLIKKMHWPNVQLLYEEIDGTYPHHTADPVIEKNMLDVKKVLAGTDIAFGIGFDGDGDRMAAMTKEGYLLPGDRLLALFAKSILKDNPGAAVVFDIKASSGLIDLLQQWGAEQVMTKTGHAFIKKAMQEHNALLGGELSCHFFFNDRYFGFDDGIYAALRLFELLVKSGKSLDELLTIFPQRYSSPEIRITCPPEKMGMIIDQLKSTFSQRNDTELITIDGVRAVMPYGWGIVRVSNTQPMLSMRFESDSSYGLKQVKNDFLTILRQYFDEDLLQREIMEQ